MRPIRGFSERSLCKAGCEVELICRDTPNVPIFLVCIHDLNPSSINITRLTRSWARGPYAASLPSSKHRATARWELRGTPR